MVAITATNSSTPSLQASLSMVRLEQAKREADAAEAKALLSALAAAALTYEAADGPIDPETGYRASVVEVSDFEQP